MLDYQDVPDELRKHKPVKIEYLKSDHKAGEIKIIKPADPVMLANYRREMAKKKKGKRFWNG